DDDEAAHEAGAEDVVLVLAAGETGTLVFTFPENDHDYTAIVCLIPGHYEAGMTTDIAFGA
ncbi:MAG: copper-binding protein, partial [Actinomycetota bacterium]|nr:copper-binding protein [Actinomycetota bacterium]MDK1027243.1 copper-binding protein [Actinomycetota bacterium]